MKIFFELTVGIINRTNVRQQLQNSKEKIKYWYPESKILLTENKGWLESKFYFEADKLPDGAESQMREWLDRIKSFSY